MNNEEKNNEKNIYFKLQFIKKLFIFLLYLRISKLI